jgi:hypothetical protein
MTDGRPNRLFRQFLRRPLPGVQDTLEVEDPGDWLLSAMNRAEAGAGSRLPILTIHPKNTGRRNALVVLRMRDFLALKAKADRNV